MSQTSNKNANLKFKKVDISFIYGYVNHNLYKSIESPQGESNGFDKMWAPAYNVNRSADGFYVQDLVKNEPVKVFGRTSPNGIDAKLSAHVLRRRHNPQNIKETDGGPGVLTIKISVEGSSKQTFDVNTVYDIMYLVPKTSTVFQGDLSKIEGLEHLNKSAISGRVSRYSSIFRLFCNLLSENQKCWNELYLPPHEDCFEKCRSKCEKFYSFYDPESQVDPQIPYIMVEGFLPKEDFEKGFMNKNSDNSMYTAEIGGLLERWLRAEYHDHLNLNFYAHYESIDGMIDKEKGVFISKFRDKKVFTLFSSVVTLLLKSEHDYGTVFNGVEAPKLTTNAFLNYLQFSRAWVHNILWLNKQLDKLTDEVSENKILGKMISSKSKLNVLKIKVAKSMTCPIFYMLDSVWGQEVPTMKVNRNIRLLEEHITKKLNLVSDLLEGKMDVFQLSDLHKSLN